MGVLSNIDPTAVTVWVATIVLFALIALLRAVFKLNFSVLTILALMLGIALSLASNGDVYWETSTSISLPPWWHR